MNSPSAEQVECLVTGGDKLPPEIGGSDALCAAIGRAAVAAIPDKKFKVEVHVLGHSSLVATLTTADGKVLPEQRFSISDRSMTAGSLKRFADTLVATVAGAP
jgi:hypothetical protein